MTNVRPAPSVEVREEAAACVSAIRRSPKSAGGEVWAIARELGIDVRSADRMLRRAEGVIGFGRRYVERRAFDRPRDFPRWRVGEARTKAHALSCSKAALGHVEHLAAQLDATLGALKRYEARLSPEEAEGPVPPDLAACAATTESTLTELLAAVESFGAKVPS